MGYSHYWKFTDSIDRQSEDFKRKFAQASRLSEKIIAKVPSVLYRFLDTIDTKSHGIQAEVVSFRICGWGGTGEPTFTKDRVCFNGSREHHENYEDMYIDLEDECNFNCCKTNHEIYDVAVCVTLLCFANVFKSQFIYWSDGDISSGEEGWRLAKRLCGRYTN